MLPIFSFKTYFKPVIWGGKRIAEFKGLPSQGDRIGESWEISPMPGHESVVAGGEFSGKTICQLLQEHGKELMGERLYNRFEGHFPLLIKLIDSNDDLSIQVHPDDALAAKRHNSLGKTEMWYSIAPAEGAYLYAGFSREMTPETFSGMVADGTIVSALSKFYTAPGDVFFLPAGCVHAIGRGNFVLEIQEASDVTYRIFDYNRLDAEGNPRQLHVQEAVDAINYDGSFKGVEKVSASCMQEMVMQDCNYFTTTLAGVNGECRLPLQQRDSFTVLVATKGSVIAIAPDGVEYPLPQGHTLLVPASMPEVTLRGDGEVVTVYIK